MRLRGTWLLIGAGLLVLTTGCGDDAKDDEPTTTSTSVTSTSASTTVAGPGSSTTEARVATSLYQPIPGTVCDLGSDPDCIDPDGDGSGTYLTGGADCMRANAARPERCADSDGDGVAGSG